MIVNSSKIGYEGGIVGMTQRLLFEITPQRKVPSRKDGSLTHFYVWVVETLFKHLLKKRGIRFLKKRTGVSPKRATLFFSARPLLQKDKME